MAGTTALKISKKMVTLIKHTKKELISGSEAIQHFSGYLDALADIEAITDNEYSMFLTEFTKEII